MQHLGKRIRFWQHLAPGSFLGRLVAKRSLTESSGKLLARSSGTRLHAGGSVAMEVALPWNDARQKSLSDTVFTVSGMRYRCVISSDSVWCNANDTVEDALTSLRSTMDERKRFMWGEKKVSARLSTITANVYHHYQKITHVNGPHIIAVDVVHPKYQVVTLCLDTKLWQAREMMNERRSMLEKEAIETRNVFGKYTELIWTRGEIPNQDTLRRLPGNPENRLLVAY